MTFDNLNSIDPPQENTSDGSISVFGLFRVRPWVLLPIAVGAYFLIKKFKR